VALCLRHVDHPFVQVRITAAEALRRLRGVRAQPLLDRAVDLATREGLDNRVFAFGEAPEPPDTDDPALDQALAHDPPLADPLDDLAARNRWHRAQGVTRYQRRHARRGGPMLPLLLFDELNDQLPAHERATTRSAPPRSPLASPHRCRR
jgi:hypothetical protein